MSNKKFNECVEEILNNGNIENMPLDNIDILRKLLYHSRLNKKIYKGFKENYNFEYGKDLSNFFMKVLDLIYRLHLLVNQLIINNAEDLNFIHKTICSFLENNSISFYDAVSFDDSDLEIIDEDNYLIREKLGL